MPKGSQEVASSAGQLFKKGAFPVKRVIGAALAAVFVVASCAMPGFEGLSHEGVMAIGVLLAAVALWFCGTMPQGVVGLVGVMLLVLLGVVPSLADALSGFTSATTWFILCVFCMTAIMQKSTLGLRLTKALVGWAGANSRKLVFAFMAGTAVASFFMTDTGAVVLGMSMALPLLKAVDAKPGSSNLGKCLMLGVAFAGVLAMRPRVLVLDEPAAGLDPAARRDFLGMISDLHKRGLTVVMVSHSMDDLARLTDRVLIMKEGEMFCVGAPAEVFIHADELNAIGLGQPCPQRMAGKLRDAGMPLDISALYDEASLVREVAGRIAQAVAEGSVAYDAAQPTPTAAESAAEGFAANNAAATAQDHNQHNEGGAR